jgi:hypothetical protein
MLKNSSAPPVTKNRRSQTHLRSSQKSPATPVLRDRIESRAHLVSLRKWVNELRDVHKFSLERIASHTWRGAKAYGYFQSIAAGDHLGPTPKVRPTYQDYNDVQVIIKTARQYRDTDDALFAAAMNVVRCNSELTGAVSHLLDISRKRADK